MKISYAIGAGLLLAWGGYVYLTRGPADPETAAGARLQESAPERMAIEDERVEPPKRAAPDQARTRPERERPQRGRSARAFSPLEAKVADAGADRQARPRETARQESRQAWESVESRFQREWSDPAWSASASEQIMALAANAGLPQAARMDVECRVTLCRIEFWGADIDTLNDWLPLFGNRVSTVFPSMISRAVHEGGKQGKVVVFLTRESFDLYE